MMKSLDFDNLIVKNSQATSSSLCDIQALKKHVIHLEGYKII